MTDRSASPELPTLPIIRTLGGCGGTLISRLFSALPGIVLLSETNPRSCHLYSGWLNPILQIRKWHTDLADSVAAFDEYEIGYPQRFGDMLQSVHRACRERQLSLLVRDFNYVDFIGVPFVWPPPEDLSLDMAAAGAFRPVELVLVRSPPAQLASLRSHRSIGPVLTAARFVDGYLAFLSKVPRSRLYRYEDFVAHPDRLFRAMCETLGVAWNPIALERFSAVATVTGNRTREQQPLIAAEPPSAAAARAEEELDEIAGYSQLLSALGYARTHVTGNLKGG